MPLLEGKVALITGAARGQGRAHALRLAQEGAHIIGIDAVTDNPAAPYAMGNADDLAATAKLVADAGGTMVTHEVDVRDHAALKAVVDESVDAAGGRLDVVVANAGISPVGGPLVGIDPAAWDSVIGVNLTGVFNTLHVAAPRMIAAGNGGSIICTSSGAGLRFVQNLADYNASKAGFVALAKTLANELAADQIRVNAIAPGTVNTPMVTTNTGTFKLFRPDLDEPTLDDAIPVFAGMMPMGKPWVEPEDIAETVLFLASDAGRYITGQVLAVDQGSMNTVM
ncbi:MAG: putative oxidoreductase, short-chain alcohol dehydrogenase family [Aeromicrobium sp.]|nr:putative oxidoreductase, short-chain alcohol dehydrogenase family [Aeromicrobium sp.]